jgi:N-acetylmuramoyl-L-alanine amidase
MTPLPAQTNGINQNSELLVVPPGDKFLRWYGHTGRNYFIQVSDPADHLNKWTWAPAIESGNDEEISYEVDGTPEKGFFRLRYTSQVPGAGETLETADFDHDGLSNWDEITLYHTDPLNADTDGDGLSDFVEVTQTHTDPTKTHTKGNPISDADADSDGDGLSNLYEVQHGLNPGNPDTDGDGIPDDTDPYPLVNAAEADPDGANLPDSLNTNLIGRWDFEKIGAGSTAGLESSTPASVGPFDIGNTNATWDGQNNWAQEVQGMPWACVHFTELNAYGKLPAAKFNAQNTETWAMWIKFPHGTLAAATKKRTLFSLGAFDNRTDATRLPHLHCYFDPGTVTGGADNTIKIDTYWLQSGYTVTHLISWPTPASLDDGNWHHLAIVFGGGTYQLHLDGQTLHTNTSNAVPLTLLQSGSSPYAYIGRFIAFPPYGFEETLGASIDRLRIYNKKLVTADALALYNQDIDRDGIPDRIEQKHRMWRDHNNDGVRTPAETFYILNPFRHQTPADDSDHDGITDLQEVALGTDPGMADTDGDLIPDGWERDHGLDPLNPSDAAEDPDGDGLTNLDEYRYNTDPHKADTDGDGVNDGTEVNHGGDPADSGDGGTARPADQLVTFTLGVGDQSDSHSEDYVLNVFRLDPTTGSETRIYTLRSGGFGLYQEEIKSFKKSDSYTFQIAWHGTSNTADITGTDGPDYDYTFKVQPQSSNSGGILLDSFDPVSKLIDASRPLLKEYAWDVADNPPEFTANYENRRVVFMSPTIVELSPKIKDESGAEIVGSEKSVALPAANSMVEEDPANNRIAHREMKVMTHSSMKGKKAVWTMEAGFTPTGASQPQFRGDWGSATQAHRNRFEASAAYGAHDFKAVSQEQGQTTIDADGYTAIRVNVPPWGLNKAKIKIQIVGTTTTPIEICDLEVPGVVVIDPGHGIGAAGGSNAIGGEGSTTGVLEHDFSLDVGTRMAADLRRRRDAEHLPIKVFMTRTSTANLSFPDRTKVARENGCDVYLSIHFNAVEGVPLRRHPFGMWDSTGNYNLTEDQALAIRIRQAVQRAISSVESEESRNADTDGITSEAHEANLQKGLDTCSDSTSNTTPNFNGNIPGHTPCRSALLEMEWMSNNKADLLFNEGNTPLSTTASTMRENAAKAMADAAIEDLYAQPTQ